MKIILFEENYIFRSGIKFVINEISQHQIINTVEDRQELTGNLSSDQIDICIFGDNDKSDESYKLVELLNSFKDVTWLLILNVFEPNIYKSVIQNNQKVSFLLKHSSEEEFKEAVKSVLKGNRYICNYVSNQILNNWQKESVEKSPKSILTTTEIEILKEIALGKSTKEIASNRNISIHTVMTHRKNIFRKIEVNSVYEASKYAMRAGIVDWVEYYI